MPRLGIDSSNRLELHALLRAVQIELPELQRSLTREIRVHSASLRACSNQRLRRTRRPRKGGRPGDFSQADHSDGRLQLSDRIENEIRDKMGGV